MFIPKMILRPLWHLQRTTISELLYETRVTSELLQFCVLLVFIADDVSAYSYIGRSTGKGALAIWTHHLTEITWPTKDTVKVQAGVIGHDIMQNVHDNDRVVVTGNCPVCLPSSICL